MNSIAFIAAIIKSQGAGNNFQHEGAHHLRLYVQMETKRLIETAIQFMIKNKRSELTAKDIQMATEQLNHNDLLPLVAPFPKKDIFKREMHISQLPDLCEFYFANQSIEKSAVKGHYLMKDGKMNPQPHNFLIRRLRRQEIMNNAEKPNNSGSFNLILEQNGHFLTIEQKVYLQKCEDKLKRNKPKSIWEFQGNVNKLFPICIEMIRKQSNQACIKLLYVLVTHSKLQPDILVFHLDKIFQILLVYQGFWSFKVGNIMGFLAHRFKDIQPQLLNIMQIAGQTYSSMIKAIAFEEILSVNCFEYSLENVLMEAIIDAQNGSKMASLFIKTLLDKEETIFNLSVQNLPLPLWIPQPLLQNDSFLHIL